MDGFKGMRADEVMEGKGVGDGMKIEVGVGVGVLGNE